MVPWVLAQWEEYHTGVMMYGTKYYGVLEANYRWGRAAPISTGPATHALDAAAAHVRVELLRVTRARTLHA